MADKTAEELADEILGGSHFAETEITLPSGQLVRVKPINFEVEKQMVSRQDAPEDTTDFILSKCVQGADLDSLLAIDATYILFKIREISYGPEYKFTLGCPACGSEQHFSVNVDKLPVERLEDLEPVTKSLPILGKDIVVRRATRADKQWLEDGEVLLDSLWRFVVSIDGQDRKDVISRVIPKLAAGDVDTIVAIATAKDYGLQTSIRIRCNDCGHDGPIELPLTQGFFSVS
jgi:hypothetical protein